MSSNSYALPIDKNSIKDTKTTESPAHKIYYDAYDWTKAIDFLCDEETPVKAAMDGMIYFLETGVTKNYDGKKEPRRDIMPENDHTGNYIVLEHKCGEYTIYGHLKHDSISVKLNQIVEEGEVIGLSGNTGWSIEPHLHFAVFNQTLKRDKLTSVKTLDITWKDFAL
ncbi:M23 family metallopeptidase [archaeon]|nr:M23 family metallopeptidase [archaeon]